MVQEYQNRPVTIPAGGQYSFSANLKGPLYVEAIEMPDAWTAANLTAQKEGADGAWHNVHDTDGEYVINGVVAGAFIHLLDDLLGHGYIRLRSGTAAAPVNQVADHEIILHVRRV